MTEPVQWENEKWEGVVQSYLRKSNAGGREFAEIVIDGNLCSAWDESLKQLAETCKDLTVRAEVRRKSGSRFWTLVTIEPIDAVTTTNAVVVSPPADTGVELRLRCLELAIAAHVGADDRTVAQVIIAYATQLENYALDVTSKPDAA